MEQSIIVNEEDKIVTFKDRAELDDDDFCRVSALLIKNSSGKFLLAQRSFKKRNDPGLWGFSSAGINEKGESYDDNIVKETEEELGVTGVKMQKIFKAQSIGKPNFFCQFYIAYIDEPISYFTIQEKEVEALRWFSIDEIREGKFEGNGFPKNLIRFLDEFETL